MKSCWCNAAATWTWSVGGLGWIQITKTNGFPKVLGMEISVRYENHVWVLKLSYLVESMKIMQGEDSGIYIYIVMSCHIIYIYINSYPINFLIYHWLHSLKS